MADNFAVYFPFQGMPTSDQLEAIAEGAEVTITSPISATIAWPDVTVSLTMMPPQDVPQHLNGMIGWVRQNGGSDALVTRIFHALGVAGCVVDPGFDADNKAIALCATMTLASGGFCFEGNTVRNGHGTDLLSDGMPRPSPEAVRYRAEILLTCSVRALLEQDAGKPDQAAAEDMRQGLCAWFGANDERLQYANDDEIEFLNTPIGAADQQTTINSVWAAEAACVMLWALSARELAPFDVTEHPYDIAKAAGIQSEPPSALANPVLRDDATLQAMHRTLAGIHWRLRGHAMQPTRPQDFVAFSGKNHLGAFDAQALPLAKNDLALGGKPLAEASAEEAATAHSIARERHRGANWLIGVHDWEHVQTPT